MASASPPSPKVAGPGRRSLLSPPMASDLPIRAQSCCRPGRLRRRWLRRGCSAGRMPLLPPAQTGGYGLLEPLAHGTKQVHGQQQASSSSSAVERPECASNSSSQWIKVEPAI